VVVHNIDTVDVCMPGCWTFAFNQREPCMLRQFSGIFGVIVKTRAKIKITKVFYTDPK
jgi:hypothetical protein